MLRGTSVGCELNEAPPTIGRIIVFSVGIVIKVRLWQEFSHSGAESVSKDLKWGKVVCVNKAEEIKSEGRRYINSNGNCREFLNI